MNRHVSGDYHAVIGEIIVKSGYSKSDALSLSFTAPGDDPNYGKAAYYEVRWSEAEFPERRARLAGLQNQKRFHVKRWSQTNPKPRINRYGETYPHYIALVAVDMHENRSAISNLTTARTPAGFPPRITDLQAERIDDDWGTTSKLYAPHKIDVVALRMLTISGCQTDSLNLQIPWTSNTA